MILQNHGFITVGRSVEEAAWLFITADQSAHAQLLAEAAGTPKLIRHEVAEPLGRSRAFGGFSFRPYYDVIVAEQPDLLDLAAGTAAGAGRLLPRPVGSGLRRFRSGPAPGRGRVPHR